MRPGSINTTFSENVRFLPWIGDNYTSHPGWPGRLLIIGEAHYADPGDDRNLTREVIERQWTGSSYPYFTKLAQVLLGRPHGEIDKQQLWSSVAFYNFVQQIVAAEARVEPSKRQWAEAQNILPEVIDKLEPDYIIATGDRLWSELLDWPYSTPLSFEGRDWQVCSGKTTGGHLFRATYIHHPSSFGFGGFERWLPLVQSFLKAG